MDFFRRATGTPSVLAVFPGAFNPPTIAHLEMAREALSTADEVLFVVPRRFPHKHFHGATLDDRVTLLGEAIMDEPRFSIGASDRGLFLEIAGETRAAYGSDTRLCLLCGRDAAERIVGWDYGDLPDIRTQLECYELLVADRGQPYTAPDRLHDRIGHLKLPDSLGDVSSSEVRRRIVQAEPWEHLVPPGIRNRVAALYGSSE